MNTIRQAIANALIKLGEWIQPNAGPVGEDPK